MSKKVLLVGCGGIGSRHLQAIGCLKEISEIHVVDGNPASLSMGQERLLQVNDRNKDIKIFWHTALNAQTKGGDLCIVATPAKGRYGLMQALALEHGYSNFLTEKVVAQSLGEYDRLIALAQNLRLNVWVHCQVRTFGVHQYIKSLLDPAEAIFFSEVGGNFGLGCNGIHFADLFLFYTGAKYIDPGPASVDELLHPSKRGGDLFDLSGTLNGSTDNGSQMVLCYQKHHMQADVMTIVSPRGRFMVDFMNSWAVQSVDGSSWKPIEVNESFLVSQTSTYLVKDILMHGHCGLPTLEQNRPAHEFILGQLQPHFNRLLKKNLDHCPIT